MFTGANDISKTDRLDCLETGLSKSGYFRPDSFPLALLWFARLSFLSLSLFPSSSIATCIRCTSRSFCVFLSSSSQSSSPLLPSHSMSICSFCLSTFLLRLFFSSASLAYLTAVNAAGPQQGRPSARTERESKREGLGGECIRTLKVHTHENFMQHECNCTNLNVAADYAGHW